MTENKHVQAILSTILTQAQTKIDEMRSLLAPYLPALTSAERRGLPKMGKKTIDFVEKAYDFARQNLNFVSPCLDVAVFGADFLDARKLWTLCNTIQRLEQGVDDSEMVARSEAYQAPLVFYKPLEMATAQDDELGAKEVYGEIRTHFSCGKSKSSEIGSWKITFLAKNKRDAIYA
jgi:hypothetical protein